MSAIASRGWCPGVHAPMPAGDGGLVRVKPPRSRLSGAAARGLADCAKRYGNGMIELTARGNLQLRGVRPDHAGALADALVTLGLAHAEPAVERIRNVTAAPLASDAALRVADAIEAALAADDALHALPEKFCFAIDDARTSGIIGFRADLTMRIEADHSTIGLDGTALVARCPTRQADQAAIGLAHAFLRQRGDMTRMRSLVTAGAAASLLRAIDLEPLTMRGDVAASLTVGFLGIDPAALAVGIPFGQLSGATLRLLADCTGDVWLHLAPQRMIVLGRATAQAASSLQRAGLIIDPADPRLRISACVGAPHCTSASVPARADAARLAMQLPPSVPPVHLAGCAKGCAHPGAAAVTLVGRDGRYDVVRNGRAGDPAIAHGLSFADAAALVARA